MEVAILTHFDQQHNLPLSVCHSIAMFAVNIWRLASWVSASEHVFCHFCARQVQVEVQCKRKHPNGETHLG